jgi:dipeptidyl aminopeptidase/acylaminoacyl peptidase
MAQIRLGDVEYVKFKSKDGTDIAGYLFKPPAYNPELKYPTLLRPHGGPVGQYEWSFDFTAQLFAANGYVVLQPNPRGSSGYGQKFCEAIFADWGNKDYEDVLAMVDYAVAKGLADPAKLGVGGWSYGGIMTNYVITKSGDRFKGAISGASESLYVANYGHDHYQKLWELELGLPWKTRALWEKISPFNQVEKIVTPTLWIGGEKDWNVPIINSEEMYQCMKRLGRATQLVVYPGEHHGIAKPSYLKDRFERYLAWFGQYVKGEAPAKTAD